jgi:hypothetical protein
MTCRHRPGDPNCGSYQAHIDSAKRLLEETKSADTPDASNFDIEDVKQIGGHLVLKVRYPNCARCAYEGVKVMVFLNTTTIHAMRWKTIDPHFRAPRQPIALDGPADRNLVARLAREAPSPAARFPGNDTGWYDACAYAEHKAGL